MIIATRSLTLKMETGEVEVPIRIFAPQKSQNGSWTCRYEIGWPEGQWAMDAAGFDAPQALVIALKMIGSEIYASNYHKAGRLWWDRLGGGYGFPISPSLRDLLEGDDAKFF